MKMSIIQIQHSNCKSFTSESETIQLSIIQIVNYYVYHLWSRRLCWQEQVTLWRSVTQVRHEHIIFWNWAVTLWRSVKTSSVFVQTNLAKDRKTFLKKQFLKKHVFLNNVFQKALQGPLFLWTSTEETSKRMSSTWNMRLRIGLRRKIISSQS